jgi:hypothetical protein
MTPQAITEALRRETGIALEELFLSKQNVELRDRWRYLLRHEAGLSYPEIGRFCHCAHSSARDAVLRHERRIRSTDRIDVLVEVLKALRVQRHVTEARLHELIADRLRGASIPFEHERSLPDVAGTRVDFLCGRVVVEVKLGRPNATSLVAQLGRYAKSKFVDALVVILGRAFSLPPSIESKPLVAVALNNNWGVAV